MVKDVNLQQQQKSKPSLVILDFEKYLCLEMSTGIFCFDKIDRFSSDIKKRAYRQSNGEKPKELIEKGFHKYPTNG